MILIGRLAQSYPLLAKSFTTVLLRRNWHHSVLDTTYDLTVYQTLCVVSHKVDSEFLYIFRRIFVVCVKSWIERCLWSMNQSNLNFIFINSATETAQITWLMIAERLLAHGWITPYAHVIQRHGPLKSFQSLLLGFWKETARCEFFCEYPVTANIYPVANASCGHLE